MSDKQPTNEPHPECIACQELIEECSWIYYGGEMGERESDDAPRRTLQIYWCANCFETKILPKLNMEK